MSADGLGAAIERRLIASLRPCARCPARDGFVDHSKDGARNGIKFPPVVQPVETAVDTPGDLAKRLVCRPVGQLAQPFLGPEQAGDSKRQLRVGGTRGIGHEINPEKIAEAPIIRASRNLNRSAPFEPLAIARLGIPQRCRQRAYRFVTPLRRGRAPYFFHEPKLSGLVRQLRNEGRDPRRRLDGEFSHRGLQERQECLSPGAWESTA